MFKKIDLCQAGCRMTGFPWLKPTGQPPRKGWQDALGEWLETSRPGRRAHG